MKKLLLSILILILYFSSNAQSPLRINKYLIDSLTGSGYWYLFHDSTHTGQWGLVAGSGGGGGGSGTVTSITQAYGIINTPNPIINTGTVKFDSATVFGQLTWLRTLRNTLGSGGYKPSIDDTLDIDFTGTSSALFINDIADFGVNLSTSEWAIQGDYGLGNTIIADNNGRMRIIAARAGFSKNSEIDMKLDSMVFKPGGNGTINIDSLRSGASYSVNQIIGRRDNNGVVGYITVGSGLSLSSGVLSATGGSQTFSNTSDATSHTVTLSNSGGSFQLVEGSNITLTTTGTASDGIITIASSGGSSTWNGITNPTGDQALTFDAGESSTWTNSNTTEDLMTWNSSTMTTSSMLSVNSTSTALASGNNLAEFIMSGANASSAVTATALKISVTNTGTTSTNVGLSIDASGGATENAAIVVNTGNIGVGTATPSAYLPGGNGIAINGAGNAGVSFRNSGSGTYHLLYNTGTSLAIFSSATGSNIVNILNGGSVNIGSTSPTMKLQVTLGRFGVTQGTDVASATGAMALQTDGNVFEITGTNTVTLISNVGWINGSIVTLMFTSTATLTDGTANSGTDIGMELAGNTNFVASADDTITLVLGEIGGVQRWREVSRSVN